jgi:hypothetical protein
MSCPFYGYNALPHHRALFGSGGNQCALVTTAHASCRLEVYEGREPDLDTCELRGTKNAIEFAEFTKYEYRTATP